MPIHDLGYRAWQGRLVPELFRFWTITVTGIRLAWQNRWLRRIIYVTWLPAIYLSIGFFMYEQFLAHDLQARDLKEFLAAFPVDDNAVAGDRHGVWSWLLWVFFRYPQGLLMVLVVGLIAPPLIARDVRTRAFLLYFSRPITRLEYLLGKMSVVWAYLVAMTMVPALLLYVAGVFLSTDFGVVRDTWDLPLRIVGATLVLTIPTTLVALAFSSLTSDTRYASFAWFALWTLGWVTYAVAMASLNGNPSDRWTLISPYHTLGRVQSWVFGLERGPLAQPVLPALIELVVLSVVSLAVLVRRVSSPMRV